MKRYVCIDVEMSEFTLSEKQLVHGLNKEVIQIGAVMLDENYNLIGQFSTYVKPAYSHITPMIKELTGIEEKNIEHADDFITAFDKYAGWIGNNDVITFCWSSSDYKQLWNELYSKARHRTDLFEYLKSFIDLQETFCKLVKSGKAVSLESAVKLVRQDFFGQQHSALSDAYNTGCILHKVCCSEMLNPEFVFLYTELNENESSSTNKNEYQNQFSAFMSPELLSQFGYTYNNNSEYDSDFFYYTDMRDNFKTEVEIEKEPETEEDVICIKYQIAAEDFNNFLEKIKYTDNMKVGAAIL